MLKTDPFLLSDEATTIYLNLAITKDDCPKVLDHHVPIFLWENSVINAAQWDITTKQVMLDTLIIASITAAVHTGDFCRKFK